MLDLVGPRASASMQNCAAKHSKVFGLMQPSFVGNLWTSGLMMQLPLRMVFLHSPQRKELICPRLRLDEMLRMLALSFSFKGHIILNWQASSRQCVCNLLGLQELKSPSWSLAASSSFYSNHTSIQSMTQTTHWHQVCHQWTCQYMQQGNKSA